MRKILCTMLVMVMAAMIFVPASVSAAEDMPGLAEEIYIDDFSDDELDALQWRISENGGSISPIDGKLVMEKTVSTGTPTVTSSLGLRTDPAVNPTFRGRMVVEFDMEREEEGVNTAIRVYGGSFQDFFAAVWRNNGTLGVFVREDVNDTGNWEYIWIGGSGSKRLTILMETETSRFSLWIDGKLYLHNVYSRFGTTSLRSMAWFIEGNNYQTFKIDNFRTYHAEAFEPENKVVEREFKSGLDVVPNLETAGDYLSGEATITVVDEDEFCPIYIMALYRKSDNKMMDVSLVDYRSAEKVGCRWSFVTGIDIPDDYYNYYVKSFLWNDMMPLDEGDYID